MGMAQLKAQPAADGRCRWKRYQRGLCLNPAVSSPLPVSRQLRQKALEPLEPSQQVLLQPGKDDQKSKPNE